MASDIVSMSGMYPVSVLMARSQVMFAETTSTRVTSKFEATSGISASSDAAFAAALASSVGLMSAKTQRHSTTFNPVRSISCIA